MWLYTFTKLQHRNNNNNIDSTTDINIAFNTIMSNTIFTEHDNADSIRKFNIIGSRNWIKFNKNRLPSVKRFVKNSLKDDC